MPAGYQTDDQIYVFIEELLESDQNDLTQDLQTLAYGAYQSHKLAWIKETIKISGKPPTAKQQQVWIESLSTETIRMTIENATELFTEAIEGAVEELLPELIDSVEATAFETEMASLREEVGNLTRKNDQVSFKQVGVSIGCSLIASLAFLGFLLLVFEYNSRVGDPVNPNGTSVPVRSIPETAN